MQFKKSLDTLMKTLNQRNPFFVRCIKPNEVKSPGVFDRLLCTRQLRYSGMMETIRIRKAGYPIRHTFKMFLQRYRLLDPSVPAPGAGDDKANAEQLAMKILGDSQDGALWQMGLSKIFLKDAQDQKLEDAREDVFTQKAIHIQRFLRGALARRRFIQMKDAIQVIQSRYRAYMMREQFQKMYVGFSRLQATFKAKKLSKR
jgi:myosin-7